MESACPFFDGCKAGYVARQACKASNPCADYYLDCHIYERKIAIPPGKENLAASVHEPP